MAIALPTGYIRTTKEPLDALYLDNTNPLVLVPYPTTLAANTNININTRYLGQFVNISNGSGGSDLYWYKDGIQGSPTNDPGDLVAFSAGGGGSVFNAPPGGTTIGPVGGYALGTNFVGPQNMQNMWQGLLYPYVPPSTNGAISPTSNLFNQTNITISGTAPSIYTPGGPAVFFTWQKNAGSVDLVSADIEYRRVPSLGPPGPWTSVGTTITSPATYLNEPVVDIDLSAPFIINLAIDNSTLQMRCAFVDQNNLSLTYYSSILSSTFAAYAAPSITNLFNDPTPTFAPGTYKLLKNFVTYSNTSINGTINRNSPLVNITGYDIEYSSNGSVWTALPGGPYPGTTNATLPIATYIDTTSIAGTTAYYTRIVTSDTEFPILDDIQNYTSNIGNYTIYNPVFAGFISSATYAGGAPYNLANIVNLGGYQTLVPNGSNNNGNASGGTCNYTNTAADKVLNNILFQSNAGDHFILAYPATYGPLTFFGDTAGAINFLSSPGAYTLTTQAVGNLTGGGSVSYNVYVQVNANSANVFPAYKIY